jgi:hypothetical protein
VLVVEKFILQLTKAVNFHRNETGLVNKFSSLMALGEQGSFHLDVMVSTHFIHGVEEVKVYGSFLFDCFFL